MREPKPVAMATASAERSLWVSNWRARLGKDQVAACKVRIIAGFVESMASSPGRLGVRSGVRPEPRHDLV